MAAPIDTLFGVLGFKYDPKGMEQFKMASDKAIKTVARIGASVGASVAATLASVTAINQMTASQEKQAEQVGLTGNAWRKWAGLAEEAGFEADIFTDLMEEMNNKIGESKKMDKPLSGVTDSFKILGLEFNEIAKLSPEDQLLRVADAALKLEDAQAAVSAVDILMGGEANKFFASLRARGGGIDALLKQQEESILLTGDSAKAARKWAASIGKLKKVFVTMGQEVSGMFAIYFGDIDGFRMRIIAFFKENKQTIEVFIKLLAGFIKKFFEFLGLLVTGFSKLIDMVGGTENALKILSAVFAGILAMKMVGWIKGIIVAFKLMKIAALTTGASLNVAFLGIPALIGLIIAAITLLALNWDKITAGMKDAFESVRNFFSIIWNDITEAFRGRIDGIKSIFTSLKEFFIMIWEGIKDIFMGNLEAIQAVFDIIFGGFFKKIEMFFSLLKGFRSKIEAGIGKVGKFFGFGKDEPDSITPPQVLQKNTVPSGVGFAAAGVPSPSVNNTNNQSNLQQDVSIKIDGAQNPEAVAAAVEQKIRTLSMDAALNSASGTY